MDIFAVCSIGIIGAILAITIKQSQPVISILVSLATGIIMIFYVTSSLSEIIKCFNTIVSKSGIDEKFFTVALKACLIAYITEFSSALCKDAGENAIAVKTEMAGKISILFLSLPILLSFISSVSELLDKI